MSRLKLELDLDELPESKTLIVRGRSEKKNQQQQSRDPSNVSRSNLSDGAHVARAVNKAKDDKAKAIKAFKRALRGRLREKHTSNMFHLFRLKTKVLHQGRKIEDELRNLLYPLRAFKLFKKNMFRDSKRIDALLPVGMKKGNIILVAETAICKLLVNSQQLTKLTFADIWWFVTQVCQLVTTNIVNDNELIAKKWQIGLQMAFRDSKAMRISGMDLRELNFQYFDEDESGGLNYEQLKNAIRCFSRELQVKGFTTETEIEKLFSKTSDDKEFLKELRDRVVDSQLRDKSLNVEQLSELIYTYILPHLVVDPKKQWVSKLPQLANAIQTGASWRIATNSLSYITEHTAEAMMRSIWKKVFKQSPFNVFQKTFEHYDQEDVSKISYGELRAGIHKLLGPLQDLEIFEDIELEEYLPEENSFKEQQGDTATLDNFTNEAVSVLARITLDHYHLFELMPEVMDIKKFEKIRHKVQITAKHWLFNPTSLELWEITVNEIAEKRPGKDSSIDNYFKYMVLPELERKTQTTIHTATTTTTTTTTHTISHGSADFKFKRFLKYVKRVVRKFVLNFKKKQKKKVEEKSQPRISQISSEISQQIFGIEKSLVDKIFKKTLKLKEMEAKDYQEIIEDVSYLQDSSSFIGLISSALSLFTSRSRKKIESLHRESQKYKKMTFSQDLWNKCNRSTLELMDNNESEPFWKKRLQGFYDRDGFGDEYFDVRLNVNKASSFSFEDVFDKTLGALPLLLSPLKSIFPNYNDRIQEYYSKYKDKNDSKTNINRDEFKLIFVDVWSSLSQESAKNRNNPLDNSEHWTAVKMFRYVKEGADVRMMHMGSQRHWYEALDEMKLNSLVFFYDLVKRGRWQGSNEFKIIIPVTKVEVEINYNPNLNFEQIKNVEYLQFKEDFLHQIIDKLILKMKNTELDEVCSKINPELNWFEKTEYAVNQSLNRQLSTKVAFYSDQYWYSAIEKKVRLRTTKAIINETFDLEDDNQSGTLGENHIVDVLEELVHAMVDSKDELKAKDNLFKDAKMNFNPFSAFFSIEKMNTGNVKDKIRSIVLEQIRIHHREHEDEDGEDEDKEDELKNIDYKLEEKAIEIDEGDEGDEVENEQIQDRVDDDEEGEISREGFFEIVIGTLAYFVRMNIKASNESSKKKKWDPEIHLDSTSTLIIALFIKNINELIFKKQSQLSERVWGPWTEVAFRKRKNVNVLKNFFALLLEEMDKAEEEDEDQNEDDDGIRERLFSVWKDYFRSLYSPLTALVLDDNQTKVIRVYDEDDIPIVTPTNNQLQHCLLIDETDEKKEDDEQIKRLIALLQELTICLVVKNHELLFSSMKDADYNGEEMAAAICKEIFGVARGTILVSEIPNDNDWTTRLRERLEEGIDYIGTFFEYVDDDLTGRLDLEEVRTGMFLLFQNLGTLPGFNLENLPEKHDMLDDTHLQDRFQFRRVIQQLLTDIIVDNLASILNEVDEIKSEKGSIINNKMMRVLEFKDSATKPSRLGLMDWTIDYICYMIFTTIEARSEEDTETNTAKVLLGWLEYIFFLPIALGYNWVHLKWTGRVPFCHSRGGSASILSIIFHILIVWPIYLVVTLVSWLLWLSLFINVGLWTSEMWKKNPKANDAWIEAWFALIMALTFVSQSLLTNHQELTFLQKKMIDWNQALLEVNGQMQLTYFEGDDRFQLESPLEFANSLYRKCIVDVRIDIGPVRMVFRYTLWVLIALGHALIPGLYRIFQKEHDSFLPEPDASILSPLNFISILYVVYGFFCVLVMNYILSRAYSVHSAQAKALILLGIGTDSKEARPEPLLQYYVDLIGSHHQNLDCWLFARDHLRMLHKSKLGAITSAVPPIFVLIIFWVTTVLLSTFLNGGSTITIAVLLGGYDFVFLSVWVVMIMLKMVDANTALKDKHLQVLEVCRHENVGHLRKLVTLEGQLLKRNRTTSIFYNSGRESASSGGRESFVENDIEENQGENQDPEEIRQKIRELELMNLRLEASMSKVQTLDEPIKLLWLTVDQGFLGSVVAVVGAGATAAIEAIIGAAAE